jgi:hypothetical protein
MLKQKLDVSTRGDGVNLLFNYEKKTGKFGSRFG